MCYRHNKEQRKETKKQRNKERESRKFAYLQRYLLKVLAGDLLKTYNEIYWVITNFLIVNFSEFREEKELKGFLQVLTNTFIIKTIVEELEYVQFSNLYTY